MEPNDGKTEQAPVAAPPVTEKPSEIVDVESAMSAFSRDDAAGKFKPEASKEEKPTAEAKPAEKPAEKKDGKGDSLDEEKAKAEAAILKTAKGLKILGEDGKEILLSKIKADGQEYDVESLDKLITWASQGIHANQRLEKLKMGEKALADITEAIARGELEVLPDGKLARRDPNRTPAPSTKEQAGEAEEAAEGDDELVSPELKATRQEVRDLKKGLADVTKMFEDTLTILTTAKFKEEHQKISGQITEAGKKFFLARKDDVWNLLKEVEDGKPKYTVEAAMQKLHDEETTRFKTFTKEHPELAGIDKTEIVSAYLKEKEGKEAPIGSPTTTPSPAPATAPHEFKGNDALHDAMAKFSSDFKKSQENASKL